MDERLEKIEKDIKEINERLENIENNLAFIVGYLSSFRK